ncbi:hypothetical protein EBQ74_07050 [bacterium]|nr:hypothetical protein [bacterium]
MTLQEIGEKYKFTKERARQIEEQVKLNSKNIWKSIIPILMF